MAMATYSRSMSTQQLITWLREKGLNPEDCSILQKEEFTGESFLLLDKPTCKELGVGIGGQLLVQKLVKEVIADIEHEGTLDTSTDLPEGKEVVHFCPCDPDSYEDDYIFGCQNPAQAAAYVFRDKVWKGRQVLKVFFLNPEVLRGWRLTTDTILEWAGVWQEKDVEDKIPVFTVASRKDKADIRVMFSEGGQSCWSMVGMEAERIRSPEPTMVLNLKGHTTPFQRSLVIHEFGHALGLEHEHQRSDFWEVIEPYIDTDRMKDDPRLLKSIDKPMKGKAAFQDDWFEKCRERNERRRVSKTEYDPESIMHYWFDPDWLKNPRHRRLRSVGQDDSLTPKQKTYLKGIHHRQRTQQLALNPSAKDIEQLQSVYGDDNPLQ